MTTHLAFPGSPFTDSGTERFGEWIGVSDSLIDLFRRLRSVTRTRDPLVIEGEAGVGKKALLVQVHESAPVLGRPLVIIDCATLPPNRAEADLFGAEGAAGALQRATGGDLLLVHLAMLPLRVQELLAERIGGASILPRLLATSQIPLADECERGRFARSLYALFASHRYQLSPLRTRREDILPLASHFFAQSMRASGSGEAPELRLRANEIEALVNHDWPGNARELKNVVERSIQRPAGTLGELPVDLRTTERPPVGPGGFDPDASYRETRARFEADFEMQYVGWLLDRHAGNISAASREARMDRKYLYDLARKHGLRGPRQLVEASENSASTRQ